MAESSEAGREPREPTPEELAEQIRQLSVADLVASAFSAVAQLSYAKLEPSSRDLDEARLGIETLRALLPVLETGPAGGERAADLRQVVANLQLAYADAASDPGP